MVYYFYHGRTNKQEVVGVFLHKQNTPYNILRYTYLQMGILVILTGGPNVPLGRNARGLAKHVFNGGVQWSADLEKILPLLRSKVIIVQELSAKPWQ